MNSFSVNGQLEEYKPLLQKLDSLCLDNLSLYPMIVEIEFRKGSVSSNAFCAGWLEGDTTKEIRLLEVTGQRLKFRKSIIKNIRACSGNEKLLELVGKYDKIHVERISFERNFSGISITPSYLIALWAYKTKNEQLAIQLLSKVKEKEFSSEDIMNYFGNLYVNEMLVAYSIERNYPKAILYGKHISKPIFKGFKYREQAIELSSRLKLRLNDFAALTLPDSSSWQKIKSGFSRNEQILYLLDRIHLLNCIQDGQPGSISYSMEQASISRDSLEQIPCNSWNIRKRYEVINPYYEVLLMKPSITEAEVIIPYLLDSNYIPTYTFFRNFQPYRYLYKYDWVIEQLLFRITSTHLVNASIFDTLDLKRKNEEIDSALVWCKQNEGLTESERLHNIMRKTSSWSEFHYALEILAYKRDSSITEILPEKFGKLGSRQWPSQDGVITKTMFEFSKGSEKDKEVIKQWQKDTADEWVQLWTSLYLIKFDKANYSSDLASLGKVLKKCDGTTYYPYAMETLLQQNESRAKQMAEGILTKHHFQEMFEWDYYREFLKLLLLNKSDAAYNFLIKGLNNFKENGSITYGNNMQVAEMECERYVEAVRYWRSDKDDFDNTWPAEKRKKYCIDLAAWLTVQYKLIEAGKATVIKYNINSVSPPQEFVDAPY